MMIKELDTFSPVSMIPTSLFSKVLKKQQGVTTAAELEMEFHRMILKLKANQLTWTSNVSNSTVIIQNVLQSTYFIVWTLVSPVCQPTSVKVYGVAKMETAHITCNVEANPPDVNFRLKKTHSSCCFLMCDICLPNVFEYFFRWTFNNSAEAKTVASNYIKSNGTKSILTFTPIRTLEYGTLMCWSYNSVGEQKTPCVFHIIAAGKYFKI